MSKVSRSDVSASCPWTGITGKPPGLGGPVDISQILGNGYANGQVPTYNFATKRFVAGTPAPGPAPTPTPVNPLPAQVQFTWDVPNLLPLQTAYEDFNLNGVFPGAPIAFGTQFDPGFCWLRAAVIAVNQIRLYVLNMDAVAVDLGTGTWVIQRF
jgi:hypothetical protein